MNFYKKELLLLLRSKLFTISVIIFSIAISIFYLFIFASPITGLMNTKEIYGIIPTFLTIILPLFTQSLWFNEVSTHHIGIIKGSKVGVKSLLLSKALFYTLLSILFSLIILPITLYIGRFGTIIWSELFTIHIALILYSLVIVNLGLLISTLIRGRVLIYILTLVLLLFIQFGSGFGGMDLFFFSPRLSRLYNGFISLNDLFISLGLATLFFCTSLFLIEKRVRKHFFIPIILLLLSLLPGGVDLSLGKRNSLDKSTKELLKSAKVPVSLDYYGTREIKEVTDLLENFSLHNKFNLRKVIGDSDEFNKAVSRFKPVDISGENYSFIVIEYLTRHSVIPLASITEKLEFEIYKELEFLINGKVSSVGILLGDNNFSKDDFSTILSYLEMEFHVDFINPGDTIPEYIDLLITIGHRDLDYSEISYIGQYLTRGAPLIIAANGVDTFGNLEPLNTPLLSALKYSGLIVEPYLIGDNRSLSIVTEEGHRESFPLNILAENSESIAADPIAYPGLTVLGIYSSPVKSIRESGSILLETSMEGWLVDGQSGLYSNNFRVSSLAVEDKLPLATYFGGEGERESSIMLFGSTRSLTNLSGSMGDFTPYEYITRSVYRLTNKRELLKQRQSLNYSYSFNENPGIMFYIIILILYPLGVFLIIKGIKRRYI